jgi:GT2 family glycosyltransferase
MPCYNAARHLATSIPSVQAQDFTNWRLYAVDDGSTDSTLDELRAWAGRDSRIHPLSQRNAGVSAARNRAMSECTSEFIAFLDADDTWEPDFLSTMVTALDAAPTAVLAYCGWQHLGLLGDRGKPFVPPDYEIPDKPALLLQSCRWPIHAVLVRAAVVAAAGGFDTNLKRSEDFDLWLRIAIDAPVLRVPRVLAYYHHHDGEQATKARAAAMLDQWEVKRKALAELPRLRASISPRRLRELVDGHLLQESYACYWRGDLAAARAGFRRVMLRLHGAPADWLYMLPALLPLRVHEWLIARLGKHAPGSSPKPG